MRVFINYKQNAEPDVTIAKSVEDCLRSDGHHVFRDQTNLKPSEKWPDRLEQEVRACNAMVSIVSNASLQSNWVLNEIDEGLRLQKRMVPILVEDLDESLKFKAFNARFKSIQWIPKQSSIADICKSVSAALQELRLRCYRELLDAKFAEYGIEDGREIFEALFGVLFQSHWPAAVSGDPMIQDCQPRLNGELSKSLAESLRNQVEIYANLKEQNALNSRNEGQDERATRLTWQTQRLKCFSDLLNNLIVGWNQNGENKRRFFLNQGQKEVHLFDDSDGEQAFASPDSPSSQGGPRDEPVPKGEIVRMIKIRIEDRT